MYPAFGPAITAGIGSSTPAVLNWIRGGKCMGVNYFEEAPCLQVFDIYFDSYPSIIPLKIISADGFFSFFF